MVTVCGAFSGLDYDFIVFVIIFAWSEPRPNKYEATRPRSAFAKKEAECEREPVGDVRTRHVPIRKHEKVTPPKMANRR